MALRILTPRDLSRNPSRRVVMCIGNFDGVHRGHQKIFDRVLREAKRLRAIPAVMTFDPHPVRILRPRRVPSLLTPLKQKLGLLEKTGFRAVVLVRFTRALSRLSPEQFVERYLCGRLSPAMVLVGSNFRFGLNQAGDARCLQDLGRQYGFRVEIVKPVLAGGKPISSTRIRRLVGAGDLRGASRLLGRPYSLSGRPKTGARRGRRLGFPTLNLVPEQECLPPQGVYLTETLVGGKPRPSVTNLGVRPTFGGGQLLAESHLLRPSRVRVGASLEVVLHRFLRPERKFRRPDDLQRQIARDVAVARRFFSRR